MQQCIYRDPNSDIFFMAGPQMNIWDGGALQNSSEAYNDQGKRNRAAEIFVTAA
jgi:hypothetical protein